MKFNDYLKKNNSKSNESDYDFEVSNLVTIARLKTGLTQEALAKLIGTKQPSIARIENGKSLPTSNFLNRIAKAIGTQLIPPRFAFMKEISITNESSASMSTNSILSPYSYIIKDTTQKINSITNI